MTTHNQRRQWLESHGWQQIIMPNAHNVQGIGNSHRFEEQSEPHRGLWLGIFTGVALLDGPRDEAMTWKELTEWIEGKSPEAKKPLAGQRSLFGDE